MHMNDTLVADVVTFAKTEFQNETLTKVKKSKTQFQDIITAASQATSLEEFKLYIAYKAAKAGSNDLWKDFGARLNMFVDEHIRNQDTDEKEKLKVLHQAMGYLMWAAYAASAEVLDHV